MVLGRFSVSGCPTILDNSRARPTVKHLYLAVTLFWRYRRLRQRALKYMSANIII